MPRYLPRDLLHASLAATLGVLLLIAGAQRLIWLQLLALVCVLLRSD